MLPGHKITYEEFMTLDSDIRGYIADILMELRRRCMWGERIFKPFGIDKPFTYGFVTEDVWPVNQTIRRRNVTISYRWWENKKNSAHNTLQSYYVWADDGRWRPYQLEHKDKRYGTHTYIKYLDEEGLIV